MFGRANGRIGAKATFSDTAFLEGGYRKHWNYLQYFSVNSLLLSSMKYFFFAKWGKVLWMGWGGGSEGCSDHSTSQRNKPAVSGRARIYFQSQLQVTTSLLDVVVYLVVYFFSDLVELSLWSLIPSLYAAFDVSVQIIYFSCFHFLNWLLRVSPLGWCMPLIGHRLCLTPLAS